MRQVFYSERRKVKITCVRKHREKAKANISKAFTHPPTHLENTQCVHLIQTPGCLQLWQIMQNAPAWAWGYYDYETLNFHISWLFKATGLGELSWNFRVFMLSQTRFLHIKFLEEQMGTLWALRPKQKIDLSGQSAATECQVKAAGLKGRTPPTKRNQQEDFL